MNNINNNNISPYLDVEFQTKNFKREPKEKINNLDLAIDSSKLEKAKYNLDTTTSSLSDRKIVDTKGLAALGDAKCAGIKNVMFVVLKVLSCLTIVFALPTFLLINSHYKNIAKKTIDADNEQVVQNAATRILGRTASEDEVKQLPLKHGEFINFETHQTIAQTFTAIKNAEVEKAEKEEDEITVKAKDLVKNIFSSVLTPMKEEDAIAKLNAETAAKEAVETRKAFATTAKSIAESFLKAGLSGKTIREVFYNKDLTPENMNEKHQQLITLLEEQKKATGFNALVNEVKGVLVN